MKDDLKVCPVCSARMEGFVSGLYDDRHAYPGFYNLYRCTTCSHLCLDKKFSSNELCKLYTDYYPRKELRVEDYAPAQKARGLRSWLKGEKRSAFQWVPENVRVLDIGCGFGQTLGYHKNRNCEVYGVEADENIRKVMDKYGFNVHVGLFNPDLYEEGFFDYVTMDQVIEHDQDLMRDLKGIHRILKDGGRLIISTPNAFGWGARLFRKKWINWHIPYHNNFVSRRSILALAEGSGFKVEKVKTITDSMWLYFQLWHIAKYPEQGHPSKLWNQQRSPLDNMVMLPVIALHKTGVWALITRLMDALAVGDNYLIILRK